MDKYLVLRILEDMKTRFGVEPLSHDFVFDSAFAEQRSQHVVLGVPGGGYSYLLFLFREALTEDDRKRLFPGKFDLGNMHEIPRAQATYEKLTDEIFGKKGAKIGDRNNTEADDAYDSIQDGIRRITGRSMQEHFKTNKSTAMKVVKTLKNLKRSRHGSLMKLLNFPEEGGSFSMSFRDAFPYKKNEEQVWLIADLTAYLSAELSTDRFEKIRTTFFKLVLLRRKLFRMSRRH